MRSRAEWAVPVVRGALAGYWSYLLAHALAGFLIGELPPVQVLAVSGGAALAAASLILVPRALPWALISGVAALALTTRFAPEWWAHAAGAPADTWHALSSAFRGMSLEVSPAAVWTLLVLAAAGSAVLFTLWDRGRLGSWAPVGCGLALIIGLWLYHYVDARDYAMLLLPAAGVAMAAGPGIPGQRLHSVVGACAVAVLAMMVAMILPPVSQTWNWGRVGDLMTDLIPVLGEMKGEADREFGLGHVGWGDGSPLLGGPVSPSDRPLLNLTLSGQHIPASFYLRGTAHSVYDGRGWGDPDTGPLPEPDPGHYPDGTDEVVQTVRVTGLATRTVFGAWRVVSVDGVDDVRFTAGGMRLPEPPGRGEVYVVVSHVPRISSDRLRQMTAGEIDPPPGMESYLSLPDTIPARVTDLARDLVEGIDNSYDRALRLEEYLRTYPYTLDAPAAPPDRDFVDFFLFDARKGYCTYYSSALAIMLRAVGIPSRWVQGFRVEVVPDDDPMGNGRDPGPVQVTVTSDRAHAWVEAYLPGYGWITMEPTGEFARPFRDHALGAPAPDPPPAPPDIAPPAVGAPRDLALVLLAVMLAAAALIGLRLWSVTRDPGGTPGSTVLGSYGRAQWLVAAASRSGSAAQTPAELAAEVSGDVAGPFSALTNLYEVAAYSRHEQGQEEAALARELGRTVAESLVTERGRLWYLRTVLVMRRD